MDNKWTISEPVQAAGDARLAKLADRAGVESRRAIEMTQVIDSNCR